MKLLKSLFFIAILLPCYISAATATWTDTIGDDNWNTNGNWDTGIAPNSAGDVAIFPTAGAPTVNINSDVIVSQLHFTSTANYSINNPATLTLQEGRIIIDPGSGSHTIAADVHLIPGALSIFNNSTNPFTISGDLSGNNSMSIQTGTTVLSGNNTTTAGTTIQPGATLQLDSPSSSPSQTLTVNGTFVLNTGGQANIDGLTGSGTINLNANNLQIANGNFSGPIVGAGGVIKRFNGTLTLSEASTYTGLTEIQEGTLNVTGSLTSDVQVDPGTTLTGTGSVGAVTNSGTVSPGDTSLGTLTVNGNYTQASTANLNIQLGNAGSTDLLQVNGTATLNNGNLNVTPLPGIYPAGTVYRFMNYTNNIGTLNLIEDSSLNFTASYFGSFAVLVNAFQGAILPVPLRLLSGNARQVGEYLFCRNYLPPNPDLLRVMAALVQVPADEFAKDLVKLCPAQFGALPLTNLQNNRLIADTIVENTEKFYWCDPCDPSSKAQEDCETNRKKTSVWIAPVGNYYNQNGIQSQIGFDSYAVGVSAGASHLFFNSFHVGGGVGYTYSKIDWDKDRGDGHINSVYLGPSLGWSVKKGFVNLLVLGSYNFYDIDRNIRFPGVNRTATNKHHSYDVLARIEGGYKFYIYTGGDLDHFYILPEARLSYLNIFEERYTESGADSINLTVDSKYSAFLQPNLLVKFLKHHHMGSWCITPAFQVGWISNIQLSSGNYKSRFYKQQTCQPHFVVKSYHRNTNQLSLGLDLNLRHIKDWIIDMGYKVDFLDNNYVMLAKIRLEKRF